MARLLCNRWDIRSFTVLLHTKTKALTLLHNVKGRGLLIYKTSFFLVSCRYIIDILKYRSNFQYFLIQSKLLHTNL